MPALRTMILVIATSVPFWAALAKEDLLDPDVLVQGEYLGNLQTEGTSQKVGIQIVALGRGRFRTVGFKGGLPGDATGRDKSLDWKGEAAEGIATFQGSDLQAKLHDCVLVVTRNNQPVGKLTRVTRHSTTEGQKPPKGAIVLFDGTAVDGFDEGKMTADKLLMAGTTTKQRFQGGRLHVEFQIPYGPEIPSRGNSGVYLQSRYEVQILDSIGYEPHNHECGGIPSIKAADVMMSYPPLQWQTYDVDFTAASFEDGKKVKPARMSVRHNGVLIHDDVEVGNATTSSPLQEGPEPGPVNLQEHGAAVRYRNIWFLPR